MASVRLNLQAERQAALAEKARLTAQAAARAAAAEDERLAAEARAQALASMTPQAQEREAFCQQCEDWFNQMPPNGNFKKQAADPGKNGLYQDALRLVKIALESPDWSAADKAYLAEALEQWMPKVIDRWDGKDQRKKLGLSKLRNIQ
jgi:hypothetical protein